MEKTPETKWENRPAGNLRAQFLISKAIQKLFKSYSKAIQKLFKSYSKAIQKLFKSYQCHIIFA